MKMFGVQSSNRLVKDVKLLIMQYLDAHPCSKQVQSYLATNYKTQKNGIMSENVRIVENKMCTYIGDTDTNYRRVNHHLPYKGAFSPYFLATSYNMCQNCNHWHHGLNVCEI